MSSPTNIQQQPPATAPAADPRLNEDRRATKLARALFRLLADRPEADLHHVFRALAPRPGGESDERMTLALASLNACLEALGRQPSRRDYDRWRKEQPRPDEFASSTFIRDACGSWPRALDAIGAAPAADPTARRLLRNGWKFPEPVLERALQLFATEVPAGKRTHKRYEQWAADYLSRPDSDDVPTTTTQPFCRPRYGKSPDSAFAPGWPEALVRAGLDDERRLRRVPGAPFRGRAIDYTPKKMLDALRECVTALDASTVGTVQYDRWARQATGDRESDSWRPIPRAMTISKEFGGWGRAMHAAGLISDEQLVAYRHRIEFDITTGRALTFLAAAMRDCGPELNRLGYRRWRKRVMSHPEFTAARVPSDVLLYDRCNKRWSRARERARQVAPATEVPPHLHTGGRAGEPGTVCHLDTQENA